MADEAHPPSNAAKDSRIEPFHNSTSIIPADSSITFKRVCLRLRSQGSALDEIQVSDKFCTYASLPLLKSFDTPHYVHGGNFGDQSVYHIILDVNHAAAPPDIKIQHIPYKIYRVHFKQNRIDPTFERLQDQWLRGAKSLSNGYWWGTQNVGQAP